MIKKWKKVKKVIVVQATSARLDNGSYAHITVDGRPVHMTPPKVKNSQRGLHVVVVNRDNGDLECSQIFDTYKSSDEFEEFMIPHEIPTGNIIIAASKDDCTNSMTDKVK